MTKITTSRRDTTDGRFQASAEGIANSREPSTSGVEQDQPLRQSFVGLEIVHVTSGRVRIRAKQAEKIDLLNGVGELLGTKEGFTSTVLHPSTKSLVVKFDESQISSQVVVRILGKLGVADGRSSSGQMAEDLFAAWKSVAFWQEQGIDLLPLLLGLAVTGRLGVNGFAAIPVYLITVEAARKVINYLQPQVSAFFATDTPEPKNRQNPIKNKIKDQIKNQVKNHLRSPSGKSATPNRDQKTSQTSTSSKSSVEHRPKLSTQGLLTKEESLNRSTGSIEYSVVHAIPGRVRFHVPRIGTDRVYARNLERLLKTDSQVTSVRINPDASSVAIAYPIRNLELSYWVNLLMQADTDTTPSASSHQNNQNNHHQNQPNQPQARSGTITTSPSMVVNQTSNISASQTEVSVTARAVEESSFVTASPTTVNEISSWWTDLKAPALSYSLAFMANFPLD
ncbi:hypothetical protein [Calothrix sp. NIES-3974]|uniref:hypothetical protein n=1 Tax=Calothrix sp. NIES-3974 TaxID=2005462 RepID=UPI000B61F195|nr:hypothetical protein [Calothrix sp. NIES-3974]BAZ07305.1 hypothetical protein NIES3974_39680 [Calothrix sp. NIES-3974]